MLPGFLLLINEIKWKVNESTCKKIRVSKQIISWLLFLLFLYGFVGFYVKIGQFLFLGFCKILYFL